MTETKRPEFFEAPSKTAKFDAQMTELLRAERDAFVRKKLSDENTQRFTHGSGWASPSRMNDQPGNLKTFSSGWTVKFEDIISGDLSVIGKSIKQVSEEMEHQFSQLIYSTISDSCDASGNVVEAKNAGSIAASFLEMMSKIEFSVDRDGSVRLPEIHAGAEMCKKILDELSQQPPEYMEKIERIKADKSASAIARESERKNKFKRFGQ